MQPSPRNARPPKRTLRFHCGKYFARTIRREDASDTWASWLCDPWAMHTLNTPPRELRKSDIVEYIKQFDQRSKLLLGIFERGTLSHVGIVRVDVDHAARDAVVSVIVERGYRGKGVQANVFMATLDYLFDTLGVDRLRASILERNTVSMRYLLKAGWQLDQAPRQQIKSTFDGSMLGVRSMSLTRDNWRAWKQSSLAKRLSRRIGA
jgi:RimJ/RimL family protein N-acetyltransferase